MDAEIKTKIICNGGTLLSFTMIDGQLIIDKNNYYDVADLDKDNIIQLRDFLNTLEL